MTPSTKTVALDTLFRALADPTRLRLLNLIAQREICVCYFVGILQDSQPKISRHLAYLRRSGLALARRQGKWMHYRLALPRDPAAAAILAETLKQLRASPQLCRDLAKLDSACCRPEQFELPSQAPQPALVSISTR